MADRTRRAMGGSGTIDLAAIIHGTTEDVLYSLLTETRFLDGVQAGLRGEEFAMLAAGILPNPAPS